MKTLIVLELLPPDACLPFHPIPDALRNSIPSRSLGISPRQWTKGQLIVFGALKPWSNMAVPSFRFKKLEKRLEKVAKAAKV